MYTFFFLMYFQTTDYGFGLSFTHFFHTILSRDSDFISSSVFSLAWSIPDIRSIQLFFDLPLIFSSKIPLLILASVILFVFFLLICPYQLGCSYIIIYINDFCFVICRISSLLIRSDLSFPAFFLKCLKSIASIFGASSFCVDQLSLVCFSVRIVIALAISLSTSILFPCLYNCFVC